MIATTLYALSLLGLADNATIDQKILVRDLELEIFVVEYSVGFVDLRYRLMI